MERGHKFVLRLERDHVRSREGGYLRLSRETPTLAAKGSKLLGGIARKFPHTLFVVDGGFVAKHGRAAIALR